MEITEAKYQEDGTITAIIDGEIYDNISQESRLLENILLWVGNGNSIAPYVKSLSEVVLEKSAEIDKELGNELAVILGGYPTEEVLSWYKQEEEARNYLLNPLSQFPFITTMANERNIPIGELVTRIITKADIYISKASIAIGKRQVIDDQIKSISNDTGMTYQEKLDAISNITWY